MVLGGGGGGSYGRFQGGGGVLRVVLGVFLGGGVSGPGGVGGLLGVVPVPDPGALRS